MSLSKEADVSRKLNKLLGKAEDHLDSDEEVVRAVVGTYETKIMGNDSVRKGLLAATNHRLIFYTKKMGGYDFESFPYENISSIEMGKQMVMGHHVKFFASGNEVKMKWIDDKDALADFVAEVKRRMKGGSPTPAPTTDTQFDLADQLRRLGELRDEGLLTDEEFEVQKQKLLAS
jgi:Bacterial PH domain/Short C-terminal domain